MGRGAVRRPSLVQEMEWGLIGSHGSRTATGDPDVARLRRVVDGALAHARGLGALVLPPITLAPPFSGSSVRLAVVNELLAVRAERAVPDIPNDGWDLMHHWSAQARVDPSRRPIVFGGFKEALAAVASLSPFGVVLPVSIPGPYRIVDCETLAPLIRDIRDEMLFATGTHWLFFGPPKVVSRSVLLYPQVRSMTSWHTLTDEER
jgi:hypothetical protein